MDADTRPVVTLLRPPRCAFAHLLAICLDAGCLTAFCTKSAPTLQTGVLVGSVLAGGGWTHGTLPRAGGRPPQSPDAVQRRAMELWRCTHRVVHSVADHNTEAGPVSSCDWGSGRDPVSVGALGPTHGLGPCTRWQRGVMKMPSVLSVCRSGYAVVSGRHATRRGGGVGARTTGDSTSGISPPCDDTEISVHSWTCGIIVSLMLASRV